MAKPRVSCVLLIAWTVITGCACNDRHGVAIGQDAASDSEYWNDISYPGRRLNGIYGIDAKTVFAVGADGLIIRYDGTTWNTMKSSGEDDLYVVFGTAADSLFAGGDGGELGFDGETWSSLSPSFDRPQITGIWGDLNPPLYAVGPYTELRVKFLHTSSFLPAFTLPGSSKYAIWGTETEMYVVGKSGLILRCSGVFCFKQDEWRMVNSSTSNGLRAVWGTASSDIFVVGEKGTILHFDGTNWSVMQSNASTDFYGVWGTSSTDVYAVGKPISSGDEAILHYDGVTWSKTPPPGRSTAWGATWYGVWAASADDVWVVGAEGILHHRGSK